MLAVNIVKGFARGTPSVGIGNKVYLVIPYPNLIALEWNSQGTFLESVLF